MNLDNYFAMAKGIGVLATADEEGKVDLALYSKPLVIDKDTVAFVMREKHSHQNLKSNLSAAYMFIDNIAKNAGIRLFLTKTREETNQTVVAQMIKEQPQIAPPEDTGNKYLVFFNVDKTIALAGDTEPILGS